MTKPRAVSDPVAVPHAPTTDWHLLDLNLLRLFETVYRLGSVSRAAEALGLTQPAASQGLARLRLHWHDALFERAGQGVRPTPRAQSLAAGVGPALALLRHALADPDGFDPATSTRRFLLHMSDLGEVRFLPQLMAMLQAHAPAVQLQAQSWPVGQIAEALHSGRLDLAVGYFPELQDTCRRVLLHDRYGVAVRAGHRVVRPYQSAWRRGDDAACESLLAGLHYVAVRAHRHAMQLMQVARLEPQVRLNTEHFMVLPALVRHSDLAVVVPHQVVALWDPFTAALPGPRRADRGTRRTPSPSQAKAAATYAVLPWPRRSAAFAAMTVSAHWSQRVDKDPGHRWLREHLAVPDRSAPA
jgi:DNA-binding transcriptional LysR family regulator